MSARAHPEFALRPFLIEDTPLLAEIFRASIEELGAEEYNESQRKAWAAAADDEDAFGARLASQLTLIGTMAGSPVGFASLKTPDGLYKIWPKQPLLPGEYAIVEFSEGKMNMQIWDFAMKPAK